MNKFVFLVCVCMFLALLNKLVYAAAGISFILAAGFLFLILIGYIVNLKQNR